MAYSMIIILIVLYLAAALLNISSHVSAIEPAGAPQTQESTELSLAEAKKHSKTRHNREGHRRHGKEHQPPSKGHRRHGKEHHPPSKGHHPPANKHHKGRGNRCKPSHKGHPPHCHPGHGGSSNTMEVYALDKS